MTASYTFDVFSSLDTATAPPAATGPAIGASKAPSCSTTALPCTARSSGWSSGQAFRKPSDQRSVRCNTTRPGLCRKRTVH
jgi:hypothetical protein